MRVSDVGVITPDVVYFYLYFKLYLLFYLKSSPLPASVSIDSKGKRAFCGRVIVREFQQFWSRGGRVFQRMRTLTSAQAAAAAAAVFPWPLFLYCQTLLSLLCAEHGTKKGLDSTE